jgi:LacI family transcriptional regulator
MAFPDEFSRLPTIHDVARLAGVSKTTASDALHGRGRVSTATRDRVSAAAESLGYRPHAGARDLTRRRSEVLGLLAGDFFDPFVAEFAGHFEREASRHGLQILLSTAGSDLHDLKRALANLIEHRVAAVVLVACGDDDDAYRSIVGLIPVISLASSGPGTPIGVDDLTGALLAMDHLLDLGHRRIAYLTGRLLPVQVDRTRFAGYRAALSRASIQWPDEYRCEVTEADGTEDKLQPLRDLLTSHQRPTAIFATSDVLALGAMSVAHELGIRVPEELSVVGFDDIQFASFPTVGLTTVRQPSAHLAHLAVEAVVQRLAGTSTSSPTLVEPELVVRTSTAPPAVP